MLSLQVTDWWDYISIIPTMIIGALVAGSTPMGGGVVAFPVMTYLLTELAQAAATYSLAIQSFGMTAASILIIIKARNYVRWDILKISLPLALVLVFGKNLVKHEFTSAELKLFFSSFWFGCGLILFWIQEKFKPTSQTNELTLKDKCLLVMVISIGVLVSQLIGSGADFLIFAFLVFRLDESVKKATYTSVIHMAWVSVVCTGLNYYQMLETNNFTTILPYLALSIPVVVFFAPIGSWVLSKLPELLLRRWIYLVIIIQYISAVMILDLSIYQFLFSILVIFITVFSIMILRISR